MSELKTERMFLFVSFLALTLFGLLMIYESSSMYAFKITGDPGHFFKKQLFFLAIALPCFFLTLLIDIDFLRRRNKELLLATFVVLLLLVLVGKTSGGARRWFYFGGFYMQPSEFLKITFLLYCADYCQRKRYVIKNVSQGLLPLAVILSAICLLMLIQPDLGAAIFWLLWSILFLFIFRARLRHLASIVIAAAVGSFFLIQFYPYRLRRILSYLNPFADPQGAGFQLIQSQIAYGSGGILGVGFGEGRQKLFFLPAAHTDFIFSIIAEEFGLLGALSLLFILVLLFHKMFAIAQTANDDFRAGILWGVLLVFFLEIVINVGVSCGVLPTKGLPFPFVSYGGSSLVVHYILLALFFNASRQAPAAKELYVK